MTPIYDLMRSARQSLDMTMYELSDPTAEQILIADHQKGVRVRVLLDRDESGGSVNQAAYSTLSAAGVAVAWANDSEIFHQKTITVDGSESAIMTGNLTPQYYATTRDFVVMDSQAADTAAIETVFDSDWAGAAPAAGPAGGDLVWSPGSESQIIALIDSATRSVVLENEEMDSTPVEDALEADARRGVSVTVIMTSDSRMGLCVLPSGVGRRPHRALPRHDVGLYIHAKAIDVDGATAIHRFGELLDRESRVQPRARDHHLVTERRRSIGHRALQRRPRWPAAEHGGGGSSTDRGQPRRPCRRSPRPQDLPVAPRSTTKAGATSPANTAVTTITE